MPTLRRDRGNGWWARVMVNGRQVACKMFPPGKKGGPEWRAAKQWEEEQTRLAQTEQVIPTDLERLMSWGNEYLDHARRTMSHKTHVEKQLVMRDFFVFCGKEAIRSLGDINPAKAYKFLVGIMEAKEAEALEARAEKANPDAKPERKRGGVIGNPANVANKYRKNMLAAWAWGVDFAEGFPQTVSPFGKVKPFAVEKKDRYVPPEGDVIKVLQKAKGQDLIMLLTLYFTGARRGEVFGLSWADVDLDAGKIRLTDHKAGNGQQRVRWLQMHPELVKALSWWHQARPCKVENVFMQVHCDGSMGQPFRQRRHFMKDLCAKAEVRPFGFHAIRHKSAAITFETSGLNSAQVLMGHYRATTTDTYVKSAGLYTDQSAILAALGGSGIGSAISELLERRMPQEGEALEAFCTQGYVHSTVQ